MKTFKTKAGTELPMLDLRGKDYLQVAHRLVWFREEHPDWGIETSLIKSTDTETISQASIYDDAGNLISMAHKREDKQGFPDHLEKSETGAVGRALAMCGYGTQFAPDMDEGERLADSPVQRSKPQASNTYGGTEAKPSVSNTSPSAAGVAPYIGVVTVPFGKRKGTPITALTPDEMHNDLAYWESRLQQEGKSIESASGALKTYLLALKEKIDKLSAEPPF